MTLHISRLSRTYVLQIGDRLVSGGISDALANKNIVYFARDAVVAVGYTGLAFELSPNDRNTPTDEWLAEILWGSRIPRGHNGTSPTAFANTPIARWRDIGQSIELLAANLHQSVRNLPLAHRRQMFKLQIAGWQLNARNRLVPILVNVTKIPGTNQFEVQRPIQRHWHWQGQIIAGAIPDGYVTAEQFAEFREIFPSATKDETESLIVQTIRDVSRQNTDKVGEHCISISLPAEGPAHVRFIPSVPHLARFENEARTNDLVFPVAYSPWIVGPAGFHAPSAIAGTWECDFGGLTTVTIEGPEVNNRITGYVGSHPRPAPF